MIEFTLHEHDIRNFSKKVLELPLSQGEAFQKVKNISYIGFFCLILGGYLHWKSKNSSSLLFIAIYFLCAVLIFMPLIIKNFFIPRQTLKVYKKIFSNHQNGVPYSARADENSLYFKTPRSESTLKWGPEIRVFEDPKYTYIFIDPQQALIINHKQVSGDFDGFMNMVKSSLKKFQN